jgi:hypothetical protein
MQAGTWHERVKTTAAADSKYPQSFQALASLFVRKWIARKFRCRCAPIVVAAILAVISISMA